MLFPRFVYAAENRDSITTIRTEHYSRFRPQQLILPASLIAVGTFGVYNGWFRNLDNSVKNGMTNLRGNHYFRADDYLQYLPAATYLALGAVKGTARHPFRERLAVGITAYLFMSAIVNPVKFAVGEKRPDSNSRHSFPSGHTATVFTGAELTRIEYGLWPGVAMYTVGVGVAFLRLYNNRHWLNDVIAGAGIGILSARAAYWMLPLYRRWFKWDNHNEASLFSTIPSYNPTTREIAINLIYTF